MIEYNGTPFQYNPAVTNINIDNQLAGILSQFSDDYIIDIIKDSLDNRLRLYDPPRPNVVAAFESTFKQLTDGFSSNTSEILETRTRVYLDIINVICNYYDLQFQMSEDTDFYSIAYWLYDLLVSNFTENLKLFFIRYLIAEKDPIVEGLELAQLRKDNDTSLGYSKKLFKDPKLAMIHCDIEYVINQISVFSIDFGTILNCIYQNNINLPTYIQSLVYDTGNFFKNHYASFILESKEAANILIYIKLAFQQIGGELEPLEF